MNIFVSYTTRDSVVTMPALILVADALSLVGRPFVDLLHNDSDDKQARVEQELSNANVLLLLETESVERSPWVQWELKSAKCLGIPIKTLSFFGGLPDKGKIISAIKD